MKLAHNNTLNGAMILVLGLFMFSVQDMIIKGFSDEYSAVQLVFSRSCLAAGLIFLFFRLANRKLSLKPSRPGLTIMRGGLAFISYTGYYLAIAAMPLADVVAITFTMPLFLTAISALVLGEKVGMRRWAAVIAGFIGALCVVSPSGNVDILPVMLAFGAAITYAMSTAMTRALGAFDDAVTLAFHQTLVFGASSVVAALAIFLWGDVLGSDHASLTFLLRDWQFPSLNDGLLLLALGVVAAVGFYCLAKAYCTAEASSIAPFEYSYVLWAVVFGILIWGEIPSINTLLGILILISSGVYIGYRERAAGFATAQTQDGVLKEALPSRT